MDRRFEPIFPGMDPFIEDQRWSEFHTNMITTLKRTLARLLVPRYSVYAETYLGVHLRSDVTVWHGQADAEPLYPWTVQPDPASGVITATLADIGDQQRRIEIRDEEGNLITVIEVLSPSNKRQDRPAYLLNRNALVQSDTPLVEIDLLRAGKRMESGLLGEGYVILVCRVQAESCHRCDVFTVGLRERLPNIPIPLRPEDGDVGISLQDAFDEVYRENLYRFELDYTQSLKPPIANPDDAAWIEDRLRAAGVLP